MIVLSSRDRKVIKRKIGTVKRKFQHQMKFFHTYLESCSHPQSMRTFKISKLFGLKSYSMVPQWKSEQPSQGSICVLSWQESDAAGTMLLFVFAFFFDRPFTNLYRCMTMFSFNLCKEIKGHSKCFFFYVATQKRVVNQFFLIFEY